LDLSFSYSILLIETKSQNSSSNLQFNKKNKNNKLSDMVSKMKKELQELKGEA